LANPVAFLLVRLGNTSGSNAPSRFIDIRALRNDSVGICLVWIHARCKRFKY